MLSTSWSPQIFNVYVSDHDRRSNVFFNNVQHTNLDKLLYRNIKWHESGLRKAVLGKAETSVAVWCFKTSMKTKINNLCAYPHNGTLFSTHSRFVYNLGVSSEVVLLEARCVGDRFGRWSVLLVSPQTWSSWIIALRWDLYNHTIYLEPALFSHTHFILPICAGEFHLARSFTPGSGDSLCSQSYIDTLSPKCVHCFLIPAPCCSHSLLLFQISSWMFCHIFPLRLFSLFFPQYCLSLRFLRLLRPLRPLRFLFAITDLVA